MSWFGAHTMMIIDGLVILIVAGVFAAYTHYGMFDKGVTSRTGRVLGIAGMLVMAGVHFADLLSSTVLSGFIGQAGAVEVTSLLRNDIHWYMYLLAIALIGSGAVCIAVQRRKVARTMRRNAEHVDLVKKDIVLSELRFRSLIEQTPSAVYCFELNPAVSIESKLDDQISQCMTAVLVECNQTFANSLEFESRALALGTLFGDLDSVHDESSHRAFFSAFVASGYQLKSYELKFWDRHGDNRAFNVNFTGVIQNGALVQMWGAESDILEDMRVRADLKSRHAFQSLVADISSQLIAASSKNAGTAIRECLRQVCRFLHSDRASILWLDPEKDVVDVPYYWNEHGGPPWIEFSQANFPWVGSRLAAGKVVRISTLTDMPAEAATDIAGLRLLNLKSVVVVPLTAGKTARGVLALANVSDEREWADRDVTDLRVIAELLTNVVVRINDRAALDEALTELRKAKDRLEAENVYLRQEISSSHGFDEIFGESVQLRKCLREVEQVAATTTAVLIQGETGTGKELIARAVHERSHRSGRPLVKVNCAALPANLIESELFGHEKGAFTGAHTRKRGRFDLADGGTLFLDEIGDFPLELQGKLLRVVQEGEFQRLGGTDTIRVDVRLLAATNRDLQNAVDLGAFRADLFYRINTFPINLPRLAEREGDIPILAEHFARKFSASLGKDVSAISASMMEQLVSYSWPGNIRELESVIQRSLISADGPVLIASESVVADFRFSGRNPDDFRIGKRGQSGTDLNAVERAHIQNVLEQAQWVIGGVDGAAEVLGIPASTLRSKMKKLGIRRPSSSL